MALPEWIRPHCCSPVIDIILLKCVAGSVGPVNLTCVIRFAETSSYHSVWESLVLVGSSQHAQSGRLLPPAWAKTWGTVGLNRVWDGASGGGHMWKLTSEYAYDGHFGIFPGIKIDSNSWAYQVLSMSNITHVQRSNNLNISLLLFLLSSAWYTWLCW